MIVQKRVKLITSFGILSDMKTPYETPQIMSPHTFNYTDLHLRLFSTRTSHVSKLNQIDQHYLSLREYFLQVEIPSHYQAFKDSSSFFTLEKMFLWDAKYISK